MEHKCIEKVLQALDPEKFPVPQGWDHVPSREFFKSPEVSDVSQVKLTWGEPNYEDIRKLLVDENQFQGGWHVYFCVESRVCFPQRRG